MKQLLIISAIVTLTVAAKLSQEEEARVVDFFRVTLGLQKLRSESCSKEAEFLLKRPHEVPRDHLLPPGFVFPAKYSRNLAEYFYFPEQRADLKKLISLHTHYGCATNNERIACAYGNGLYCDSDVDIDWSENGEMLIRKGNGTEITTV